ncbi:geranyltranstransferase [Carnobacterium sp. AT7]|uniref:polyprenyl synthetase family protein n=1 Tax=Carnobacterium sp. AT7 TaxID=333990 RepID=UPI00015F192E|nr:farnesyl diphosphate synthase [Carnobacterium sp. AT7]EDP68542.1 geranyltranstransferase [Carnobacterium sp. AT7]
MNLKSFKENVIPSFEKEMLDYIGKELTKKEKLHEAMSYSIAAGGKRIRPLLLLATIQSLGGDIKKGYAASAALEFIHTYSLIHDDLPAMDDDDLRRGKPTSHIVYGEDIAILAGDALLTQAFEIIADSDESSEKKVKLISALAKSAGPKGMILGQMADIQGEKKSLNLEELQFIHRNKTGELLKFPIYAACVIADTTTEIEEQLMGYAEHIGLAYQIRDDILDVIGDVAEIGKNTGMDEAHNKSTYPGLLTLEGAKKALAKELTAAKTNLNTVEKISQNSVNPIQINLLTEMIDLLVIG